MRFSVPSFDLAVDGTRVLWSGCATPFRTFRGNSGLTTPPTSPATSATPSIPFSSPPPRLKIYYDRAYGGVYKRSNFFVNIDPFTIDSLDNTSTEGLVFGGSFTSAGIFPVKRQDIRVQRDYSLGFTEETGPEGWRAYQGAGQAQGKVQLSIAGLRVDGDLVYQQSRGHSSEFVLFPDSARGQGQYTLASVAGPPRGGGHPSAEWFGCLHALVALPERPGGRRAYEPSLLRPTRNVPMAATGRLTYPPG